MKFDVFKKYYSIYCLFKYTILYTCTVHYNKYKYTILIYISYY